MEQELCISCKKEPIYIKKSKLCNKCYMEKYRKSEFEHISPAKVQYSREIEFIKNYFNHNNWIYEPAIFKLEYEKYTPDFYDKERNVFIEVVGTRQAYNYNKEKYILLRKLYPKILFEIRNSDGKLMEKYMEKTKNDLTE